jgi:hypothetical protein
MNNNSPGLFFPARLLLQEFYSMNHGRIAVNESLLTVLHLLIKR